MKLETVHIVKCQCGYKSCDRYGLSIGHFYQGCGWSREEAEEIARRCNMHEELVKILRRAVIFIEDEWSGTSSDSTGQQWLARAAALLAGTDLP